VFLALALALPLVLTLAYAVSTEREDAAANARRSTVQLARLAAAGFGQFMGESRSLMETFARRPLVAAARPGHCDPELAQVPRLDRAYANVAILDRRGLVICTTVPIPAGRQPVSLAGVAWFERVKATGRFTVGEPFVGPITHRWVSFLAAPLRARGRISGYLALPVDLVRYQQDFAGLGLASGSIIEIVGRQGIVVARAPASAGSVGAPSGIPAGLLRTDSFVATDLDGVRRVYGVASVPGTSWRAVSSIPAAAVFAGSNALVRNILVVSLAALALGLLSAVLIGRAVARPIRTLAAAAARVSHGERNVRLQLDGPREVSVAAAEFNRMVVARERSDEEQARLNERLNQAQRLEAIGRLAGGVAHDFNNLLLVVRGYGELAVGRLDGDESGLRDEIREMLCATERATALTAQLLAFSRRQVLSPEVLDLNDVLDTTSRLLGRLIGEHIEFVTSHPTAPVRVLADQGQLEQVITNLAVNGRDAMPDGGTLAIELSTVELDETAAHHSGPGRYALLAVTDSGEGMDDETRRRVFEPFFTTKDEKGTGLGLATVHGIVNQSGGHIYVYSELGHGTTFKVYLPLVEDAVLGRRAEAAPGAGGRETILLVEDDPTVRTVVLRMLGAQGYTVLDAENGAEALEIVDAHPAAIPLVITDLVMRGLTGRETAAKIRERSPATRVLYMSGYTDDSALRSGSLESGSAFIQKPFGAADLARRVREILDGATP